jgi:hypothetical protein
MVSLGSVSCPLFNDRRGIMPKRKKVVKLQERPRNLLTLAPIMQKGGAHGKSDKALRRAERQQTQLSAREEFSSRGDAPIQLLAA